MTSFLRCLISATFVASGMLKAVNLDAFGQTVGSFPGLFGLPPEHAYALGALVCAGETARSDMQGGEAADGCPQEKRQRRLTRLPFRMCLPAVFIYQGT